MAAKRKAIAFSQQTEAQQNEVDFRDKIASDAAVEQSAPIIPSGKFRIFRLKDTTRTRPVTIDGIDDVMVERNGKMVKERVRCLTGWNSIWVKDQKDIPKEDIIRSRRSFTIDTKIGIFISENDTQAIEFFEIMNRNLDNPNRLTGQDAPKKHLIYEWNPTRQAEAERKLRMKRIDAIKMASEIGENDKAKMRKHALYLGIGFSDAMGLPKTDDAIRNDYELFAESNPDTFINSVDNKTVDVSWLVKHAISDALIDLHRQPNQAHWAKGGFIANLPLKRSAIEYLVELALTNSDEGKAFLEQLQAVVSK